ncbi:MAG: hypothetical protein ACREC8_11320 [Limisphaerales bacterium]
MKTPREILLERHQTAAPKLDTIRCEIVGELNNRETKKQSFLSGFVVLFLCCSKTFWRELILPSRRIWASLAAIWVFIFILNFSQRDKMDLMAKKSSPSPEMILTFGQQQRLLAELIGPDELRATEPPKIFSPRPRSECVEILTT